MLTREQIIGTLPNLKRKKITVDAWGGDVLIRELNGAERDDVETHMMRGQKNLDFRGLRVRVILMCLIKEDGNPLFDAKKDTDVIQNLSASAIEEIFIECAKLSGLPIEKEGNVNPSLTDPAG